jgi:hypothetical protein
MANLSKLIKNYKGDISKVYVNSCLVLSSRVKEDTPIEFGTAKQGWISDGAPNLFQNFTYSNNVEYIIPLEYNQHSPQAPSGMLRKNVRNWNSIVSEQARVNK